MRLSRVTSTGNAQLKKFRSLQERQARQKTGLFLIEGETLINEALDRGVKIDHVILEESFLAETIACEKLFVRLRELGFQEVTVVDKHLFKEVVTTTTPSPVVATAEGKTFSLQELLDGNIRTVLLGENIQDPGNLGTMMRSSLAFDVDFLFLSKGSVDPYSPKVVRSAMGGLFDLPVCQGDIRQAIETLRNEGFTIVAFSLDGDKSLTDFVFPQKTAILVGNEANGLTEETEALASSLVKIPHSAKIESLNVAIATAIALWQRQNGKER